MTFFLPKNQPVLIIDVFADWTTNEKAKHKAAKPESLTKPQIGVPTAKRSLSAIQKCHAILVVCDGKHREFTLQCGSGTQVVETWKRAQLEPNTPIEAEGLSANTKARAERYDLQRLNRKKK
ncbi:7217_t:CDS:2, partial [Paraglomus occultum]